MSRPGVITLPQRADMRRRLISVDGNQYLISRFYPIILRSAGHRMVGEGVVTMLVEAIESYAGAQAVISMLRLALKEYVTALVDDEQVRADAYRAIEERAL